MSTTIKLRRGASTAFSTNNPTLQAGEPAFETDTGKLKIGDGTTAYNSLSYIGDGLKNNSTASNSLAILGTTSGSNNTIIGSGSTCSSRTNSTIIGASSSATSGNGNILVGYNNTTGTSDVIIIGNNVSVSGSSTSCVRIGNNSNISSSSSGIAIGYGAGCTSANHGVAIGYNAKAQNADAIQLGQGSNTTASTLKFMSYQLVNSSGKIPNDRLNIDSAPTSASTNTVTSGGVYTALSGKADTDLTNVTDTGYIKMAGASMPSNTYEDLTLGASGSSYTAPADGWFVLDKTTNGENQRFGFYNSALGLSTNAFCPVAGNAIRTFVPAKKGEQYIVTYDAGGTTNYFRFIYAQGSESEAN